ncbi:DNA primase [Alcaligenaceae bacterium CGII-47]|nr:DNA primase [Alcaligenaceae bacterium CGII-47]
MIPESFIQELLARIDITDVVGQFVQLRKGGANLLGLCPFHTEKSPSFTVSPTKQFYHCFGCGAHGSAIRFLTEHTGASFPEAVRTLAAGVGMTVPEEPRSPRQRAADRERKQEVSLQQQILDQAQNHYLHALKQAPEAVAYLKGRGLTGEIAVRFGLGWAGRDRRALAAVFPRYEDAALLESGLVIESEDGRRYDRFRERIIFPIRNTRGHLIGFGGRIIGKGEPKYLNSPETSLFSKGHELYGLYEARAGIRKEGCVLVVEGYMDVVALAQHGLDNAVATLGTATSSTHIQKLLRASDCIVFSFDGDQAGRKAAWRALNACLEWATEKVAMRFLFLPENHDPDSYVRAFGAEAFRAYLSEAIPLSRFMLDELCARHALDEAEGRAACMHEARPLFAQIPEGGFRLQLEREFAQRVRLTPEELVQAFVQAESGGSSALFVAPVMRGAQEITRGDEPPPNFDVPIFDPVSAHEGHRARRTRRTKSRVVTPMAKRLLRLLLAHPQLVIDLGDQQLELLARSPHLVLVQELIALASARGASHAGALLEFADPGSDLGQVLVDLSGDVLEQDDLPDPQAEWNDALRQIELQVVRTEQNELIDSGLSSDEDRTRYQELGRRLARLLSETSRQLK